MQNFRITRIGENIYHILDPGDASFYVVEGTQRAAVIDTGITPGEKITPVIRSLTDKPLILVLTHAHVDHFHHMDEFDTVYMSHRELSLPEDFLRGMMAGKDLALHATRDVHTGDLIDLGGNELEICEVPGHTPGSIVVLERKGRLDAGARCHSPGNVLHQPDPAAAVAGCPGGPYEILRRT